MKDKEDKEVVEEIEEVETNKDKSNINNILMKHNDLIRAKHCLKLVECRVFEYLLFKFQKDKSELLKCTVSKSEFEDIIGKGELKTIKGIQTILESLRVKRIDIIKRDGLDNYTFKSYGHINGYSYESKSKMFEIEATAKIYELVKEYYNIEHEKKTNGYTPVNLRLKLSMGNTYALRFYDLLRVWSGTTNEIEYSIKELKDYLCISDKYDRYADFKRRVLDPAIKELNEKKAFDVEYSQIKEEKKVVGIKFIVKDLEKRKYFGSYKNKFKDNEHTEEIENIEEIEEQEGNNKVIDMYEDLFEYGSFVTLKKELKEIDFEKEYVNQSLKEAIAITLEKNKIKKINHTYYKFFLSTLTNKIERNKDEYEKDLAFENDIEKFWEIN